MKLRLWILVGSWLIWRGGVFLQCCSATASRPVLSRDVKDSSKKQAASSGCFVLQPGLLRRAERMPQLFVIDWPGSQHVLVLA